MHHGTDLIQRHIAIGSDRHREDDDVAADAAFDRGAVHEQLNRFARRHIDEARGASRDGQGVGHRTRTIGFEVAGEGRGEGLRRVGGENGLVHRQDILGARQADGRTVILEVEGRADIGGDAAGVAVLVGDGRRQGDEIRRRQGLRLIVIVGVRVLDGADLVERHIARPVDRDGEHHEAAGRLAFDRAAVHGEQNRIARRNIDEAAGDTTRLDAQRIGDAGRAVGAAGRGEQTRIALRVVGGQHGFIDRQRLCRAGETDRRPVILEADADRRRRGDRNLVAIAIGRCL